MYDYSPLVRGLRGSLEARAMRDEELAYLMDEVRDARLARSAADAANRGKGQFIARMGHEIATPLNAIGGHVQLIGMGLYGPVTDEQRAALDRVERAQRHLVRLSNDLLNFARLESGHIEYRHERVELDCLPVDLEPMIAPQARARRLSLDFSLGSGTVVVADHDKLMQVMLNLLSNAVKFTPPDGTIVVDLPRRTDGTTPEGVVYLRVRNDCEGIAPDKLTSIFEPFVQLGGVVNSGAGNAGLGLAISRELMLGMGGQLRARSVPGQATFTVALPKAS